MPEKRPITVTKEFHFEAAHSLPHHGGKCHRLHGHSYRVVVSVDGFLGASGTNSGMVIDFAALSALWTPLEKMLDHHTLNHLIENPTVERLAEYIFDYLDAGTFGSPGTTLAQITVWETATCSATVRALP